MGVYIKKLQAEKVKAIFKMLGLHIEDGDIIEVPEPHGDLIDLKELHKRYREPYLDADLADVPIAIEAEGE